MKISLQGENPYGELICQYFHKTFPKVSNLNSQGLLEVISSILIGTKETRYGSIPLPEHQVVVRKVIATAIERGEPIPILIPWGGRKAIAEQRLDVAEIAGLRQLILADNLVKSYYPSGLNINIRIEDLGAMYMYRKERKKESILQYSSDFERIIYITRGDTLLNPISEWSLMDEPDFFNISDDYATIMLQYLHDSDQVHRLGTGTAFSELIKHGWKGEVSWEQRQYYYDRYKAMNPIITEVQAQKQLAEYLANSLVRYQLNGRAEPKTDYGFIQLTYVQPIPGVPTSMFNNTLYWRPVPLSESRSHISPWRAKGYLCIQGNDVKTKVTSFNNSDILDQLIPSSVVISNDDYSVQVQADYLLTD